MEKQRYCGFVLPLQEIILRRTIFNLWIKSILETHVKDQFKWFNMESKVGSKLLRIELPEKLKKQLTSLVKPIGYDILNWSLYHTQKFNDWRRVFDLHNVRLLRRTRSGSIDYQKTAEALAECEEFDVWLRFEIACLYCLEDEIRRLWGKLPAERKTFYDDKHRMLGNTHLASYWCFVLREEGPNLRQILEEEWVGTLTFHQNSLKLSAIRGNKAATQYFFQKLSIVEPDFLLKAVDGLIDAKRRLQILGLTGSGNTKYSDVLCYLLSEMSPEQQILVFKKHSIVVLTTFLDWPCHDLLPDIADLCWSFYPESDYSLLVTIMHNNIQRLGYYIPSSLQEFFRHSPPSFKKLVDLVLFVDLESFSGSFFAEFFAAEDTDTLRVIFKNVEAADRTRLVFSEYIFKIMNDHLAKGKWDAVEVCVREASLSKEDRDRLRTSFMEYVSRTDAGMRVRWRTHKRRRFFELLDEMDSNSEKRSAEEEALPPAKKLSSDADDILPKKPL